MKGIGGAHQHVVGEMRWRRAEALDGPHQDLCVPLVQHEAVAPRVEHALRAIRLIGCQSCRYAEAITLLNDGRRARVVRAAKAGSQLDQQ